MRIYMQMPATDGRPPRYYQLLLQQDLLEGWTLIKEWGYQGAKGRVRREQYPDSEVAQRALVEARDTQLKKGYQVVFASGNSHD
jgi:predicted DNA-binding WGR domain protein